MVRHVHAAVAVRGERLALIRVELGTADLSSGAPQDEMLQVVGLDEEGRIALQVWFDIEDVDAAIAELDAQHARFDELQPKSRRLENAASRADERVNQLFTDRRWDEFDTLFADDLQVDDRRRGVRRQGSDRATELANARAIADIGVKTMTSRVLAIRGERVALVRTVFSGRDHRPEAFHTELLRLAEIDTGGSIVAMISFDLDDVDAAYEELEARYLAGEAAPYARVWQIGMETLGELNRHEPGRIIAGLVYTDHRHVGFAPGDFGRAVEELWALVPDARYRTPAVYALDAHGLVVKFVIEGTDIHGSELQWPRVLLLSVGREETRLEVYEEDDVDAALARFEELRPQARWPENAASQAVERYFAHFAARDWDALAMVLADDISIDDRRRVVNAGIRHGRDAEIANLRGAADAGFMYMTSVVIAARGERLILVRASGRDRGSEEFLSEALGVAEINSHNQIAAIVVFDLDDVDAAYEELEARYLAGEAAPYARVWQIGMETLGELNRHEPGRIIAGLVYTDHRHVGFAPADFGRAVEELWALVPDARYRTPAVYALDAHGLVVKVVIEGTDIHGNELQWPRVYILSVGREETRLEVYEEDDVDAALARFEELRPQTRRLENAASQAAERYFAHFAARDWDALAMVLADDISIDDRRRVVNAGIRHGRDAEIANLQAAADAGITYMMSVVIAAREERLVLVRVSGGECWSGEFLNEALGVVEITSHNQIAAIIVFDLDDFDAAVEELDARYLAGEAAAHARTWSVITQGYAAQSRHELPAMTPDCVTIDHRRANSFAPGEMTAYIRAGWDLGQTIRTYVEVVHRLSDLGAVCTYAGHGVSREGFEAEWREVAVTTVAGDMANRCELVDEADLDAALARFDQLSRSAPRLENAASQAAERLRRCFAARDWDGLAEILTEDILADDRRRIVGTGIRRGREANVADIRAGAEVGAEDITSTVIATRGERIALDRALFSASHQQPEALNSELLRIVEIDTDNRITCCLMFDLDDFDSALAELDARYLAGEAAAHAHTWSLIARTYAGFNRQELPATTQDWVNVDHRHAASMAPGEGIAYFRASWELAADLNVYIEAVHRLSDLGAVLTHVGSGTSRDGFEAEWRTVNIMTIEGDLMSRGELFDEEDLDDALARFEQLSRPAPRLENAATRVFERLMSYFAARDWDAVAQTTAENVSMDDRRRVVNAEILHGRDANIKDMQATADVGFTLMMLGAIATRGGHLALTRVRASSRDPEAIQNDALNLVEIDADDRTVAMVVFDVEDIDTAFEELDARYLAGEAAAHARTWSVVVGGYAALNRREIPLTTPDFENIDHRRGARFAPGDLLEYLRVGWDLDQDVRVSIEAAHRLSDLGAVVTHTAYGTSREGFDAEWREVHLMTADGEMFKRSELFDEADLDAALARFEQLSRSAPRLENTASRVDQRLIACVAARDWDAMAEMLTDGYYIDDRRRAVNVGLRRGRDLAIAGVQTFTDLGITVTLSDVIATRGERLVLSRFRWQWSAPDQRPEAFHTEVLNIVEINADECIVARIWLDTDDFDVAFEELDARYLAGEAAAHAHTWSVITQAYAAINRHEIPATTPDWVATDHRRGIAFAPGDATAYLRASQDPQGSVYVETVPRLSNLGAVFTWVGRGTSQEGFEAEWRGINVLTVEGDLINRGEIFDEADTDAAIARFDQLNRPAPRLENAASRVAGRVWTCFAARDWDSLAELFADDIVTDDRRRVVSAGVFRGRDAQIANMRVLTEMGTNITSTVIATRGERLALTRISASSHEEFGGELLSVIEVGADDRATAGVQFDPDDFDGAFAELDARYIAGEAAAHAHTWSVIAGAHAAINRRQLPATTPDWVNIDHRQGAVVAPGDVTAYIRASFDGSTGGIYVETVHRLSNLGAVVTWAGHGTSPEGFEAEWRAINVLTVEGDRINRSELFDEADLTAAIAHFDELHPQAPRLENAASRVGERYLAHFAAGDWDGMAEILADDFSSEDRRRVVGAGVRHGRDAEIVDMRAIADLGLANVTSTAIATRGGRLVLSRVRFSDRDHGPETVLTDVLIILEINADERIVATVTFDLDDIDGAFAELDARYLAGEAAVHAHTWSAVAGGYAAFNRHEFPQGTPEFVDNRRATTFASSDPTAIVSATWDLTPDLSIHVETVHLLSDVGAVVTHTAYGTSPEGFEAEWRMINLSTVEGDLVTRCELFVEEDIDAAIARFDELHSQARCLENAASRLDDRFGACLRARDWVAMAEILADDSFLDDRRRVVGIGVRQGRDVQIADFRAAADRDITAFTESVIATRGERLALRRVRVPDRDQRPEAFHSELLGIVEIDTDERIVARFLFGVEDVDAAFAELDARYLAGEAADHAHTWSAVTGVYAALNRREHPAMTRDSVCIDRRPLVPIETVDLATWIRAVWDLTPDLSNYIETVHRLSNFGAVLTHAAHGTSQVGFGAEWRLIAVLMFEGDRIGRLELFDEADIDAALARFEELQSPSRRLENAASRADDRFFAHFAARNWAAMAELLADDVFSDDRRRVVNAGSWEGRDVVLANMQALVDGGTNLTMTVVATRGERLALIRLWLSDRDQQQWESGVEMLNIAEIGTEDRITAHILFDPDKIDAAFAELDARYLAGEAAAHAHTWTLVAGLYAGLNRHELPQTTPDFVDVDHRRLAPFAAGDIIEFARTAFDQIPDLSFRIEAVHRLSNLGAVVTQALRGTSREGFEAEWREIHLTTLEGEIFSRSEIFDEADLDAAIAKFEQLSRPAPRLENLATRLYERLQAYFAAREWDAMAEILADDHCSDDRRLVVNAGIRHGRDVQIANMQTAVGLGTTNITSTVIATRGERLALRRVRFSGRDQRPEAFHTETLGIVEIDADERITALVTFDLDDIDAAFEELHARYVAGEAAAHSHTWSVIAEECAAFNRHELTAVDYITVDHRPLPIVEAYSRAALRVWDVTPDFGIHIEAVHRLSGFGAVATYQANGTSPEGFDGEWRMILLLTVEGDRINRCEVYDDTDVDAALARFEELQPQAPRLENAAGRILVRYQACFSARDWATLAQLLADDITVDDRRRAVNAGVRRGREVHVADTRAAAEVGAETISLRIIATRGQRLALAHVHTFNRGMSGEVGAEMLGVAEIDADERIVATVSFDLDDIDAAYEELDARYLAGEAAAHAHTWSVIARTYAALSRRELPPTAPDWVNVDHRRVTTTAPGHLIPSLRAIWDLMPEFAIRIETVNRLTDLGAVFTYAAQGTSQDGVDAEWREIAVLSVEGDRINRCELFDEADLDAALARFEELQPRARRLENAATQVAERLRENFAARDWTARAELLADDCSTDDRRRVVNAGNQHGRDSDIANMRAIAAVGVANIALTTIATRGERLALSRARMSGRDQRPEAFYTETLTILEIDTNNRAAAQVVFDPDDIDAAFEELDARYLAGEGAAHAHAWSVIAGANAGFNRRELPAFTADLVYIDHRPLVSIEAVDLAASLRAVWDITSDVSVYIEAVHRLSELGTVVTQVLKGTSQEGFDAEWRMIEVFTVEGDLISRAEIFDETDLDAALARFDELHPSAWRLENAASQVGGRFMAHFAASDWDGMAAILADNFSRDDRRRVVGAGVRSGRDAWLADMRATADLWIADFTSTVTATRGGRLVLMRGSFSHRDQGRESFLTELLGIIEINADERIAALVTFDPDDIDAAFAELDARYLAGEAAAQAHTWSVVAQAYSAMNRHELPATTQDWVNVDHRPLQRIEAADLGAYVHATWDVTPHGRVYIEAVHRISDLGAVVTYAAVGTSQEGFDAEWRAVNISTVEGELISRSEIFDEADLDAALARFEELHPQPPRLENAASRVDDRFEACFEVRDWDAMAEMMADDISIEDRRRVVNAGIRGGRDAEIANMRARADVGVAKATSDVIATRGARLALSRNRFLGREQRPEAFHTEALAIVEIDGDSRIVARVGFDIDDIDAAFEELEARYLAGEAAAHAHTWSVIARTYAAFNRHEFPSTTPDSVYIDHRPLVTNDASDLAANIRATWDLMDVSIFIAESVHRLSERGAVVTQTLKGTSKDGLDVEYRMIDIFTVERGLLSRCEVFDEADLDAALARFDELHPQPPRLENAVTQGIERFLACFASGDWDGMTECMAENFSNDDRRRVVGAGFRYGRDAQVADMRAIADVWTTSTTQTIMAIRGERVALGRFSFGELGPDEFVTEFLSVLENDSDGRAVALVSFDVDDIVAAFEELDARYLAGEAAAHAHTWSVITSGYAATNRRELPQTTQDWVSIDHRRAIAFAPGELIPYIQATWDIAPDINSYAEAAHRLSNLGAVVTQVVRGTSQQGFDGEWREIVLVTVEGDLINRIEIFDEADLDAALARFDELDRPPAA